MSTIFKFNEKDAFESIKTHYFNDGLDVCGFVENGDVYIEEVDADFVDGLLETVKDVFCGNEDTYVVTSFVDKFGTTILYVFRMTTAEYYAKWELAIRQELYSRKDHSNEWIWFNIGQNGDYFVQWKDAVIRGDFDPRTIRIEAWDNLESEHPSKIWVKTDDPRATMPRSVDGCFDDLFEVAKLVEKSYWVERDVHVSGRNSLHIRDVFDMDDVNEYGVGKSLWD